MLRSKMCLIASMVCFTAGATIFILALFFRIFDPEIAGLIGSALIFAFLALSMVTIAFRNKERAEEKD